MVPTDSAYHADAAGVTLCAGYAALIGYIGGVAFEGNAINGMLLAFGLGLVLAGLIEGGRRIAARSLLAHLEQPLREIRRGRPN